MPGYAKPPEYSSIGIAITPTGDISATNLQDAIAEIASEKATVSNLTSINNTLSAQISSVEGIALLGL